MHAELGHIADWDGVVLRGSHNRQNVLAAVSLAGHAGATRCGDRRRPRIVSGVEHRLEVVGVLDGVTYVNNSKSDENPDAAMAALDAYPRRVHLIAGGKAKGTPFEELVRRATGAVVHVYLIGDAASELADAFLPWAGFPRRSVARWPPRSLPRVRPPILATRCCSRRHAPASINTRTSKRAARIRVPSRRRWGSTRTLRDQRSRVHSRRPAKGIAGARRIEHPWRHDRQPEFANRP